jgi:adenosine deaminase
MCPLSNVRTGVVGSLGAHPVRPYFEQGLLVTVNTDDPKMFGNSLAEEYRSLVTQLGFSRGEIQKLILNAVAASWLPLGRKHALATSLRGDPGWESAA